MGYEQPRTGNPHAMREDEEKYRCAHCGKAFHEIRYLNGRAVLLCRSCGRATRLSKEALGHSE